MKKWISLLCLLFAITSCQDSDNDDDFPKEDISPFDRTVLVYMSAENNLSSYVRQELAELKEGSLGIGNNALVIYVDLADEKSNPYIIRIANGVTVDSTAMESDPLSSSPNVMANVLDFTSSHYPASEYGLVLWGHASGWIFEDSVSIADTKGLSPRIKAYGIDNGRNSSVSSVGTWINIPTIAKTLMEWGHHLRFIMADCCQFQCIETAFELRNVTDYVIGSPAEIPAQGAPYNTITKSLFLQNEDFYQSITDNYFAQVIPCVIGNWNLVYYQSRTPLSVIKTSELGNLATATAIALQTIPEMKFEQLPRLDTQHLIYYYGNDSKPLESCMYDMNDLLLHYAEKDIYANWKVAFDRAIVYKQNAKEGWMTAKQIRPYVFGFDDDGNASTTILTDERYGGVSMFVPQNNKDTWYEPYKKNNIQHDGYNREIRKTAWYYAARLFELGW